MWRTATLVAVMLAAVVVLVVPFHPETVVLHAGVAATLRPPLASRVDWFLVETGGNFVMFAAVGAAVRLLMRGNAVAILASCLISIGAELGQLMIPNRVASWSDVAANALGAAVGVVLISLATTRRRASGARRSKVEAR